MLNGFFLSAWLCAWSDAGSSPALCVADWLAKDWQAARNLVSVPHPSEACPQCSFFLFALFRPYWQNLKPPTSNRGLLAANLQYFADMRYLGARKAHGAEHSALCANDAPMKRISIFFLRIFSYHLYIFFVIFFYACIIVCYFSEYYFSFIFLFFLRSIFSDKSARHIVH